MFYIFEKASFRNVQPERIDILLISLLSNHNTFSWRYNNTM